MKRALAALLIANAALHAGCSGCSKDSKGKPAPGDASVSTQIVDAAPPPLASRYDAPDEPDAGPPLPPDTGSGFEGTAEVHVEERGKAPVTISILLRGDRLAFEAPNRAMGEEARSIYDVGLKRMVLLIPETKQYVVFDDTSARDKDAGAAPVDAGDAGGAKAPPPRKTAAKEKLTGGLTCDVYEITGARKAKTTACIADGVAFLDYGKLSNAATSPPEWLRAMSGGKRFPARVVVTDEDGDVSLKIDTTFTRGPRSLLFFSVPPAYTRLRQKLAGSAMKPGLPD